MMGTSVMEVSGLFRLVECIMGIAKGKDTGDAYVHDIGTRIYIPSRREDMHIVDQENGTVFLDIYLLNPRSFSCAPNRAIFSNHELVTKLPMNVQRRHDSPSKHAQHDAFMPGAACAQQ